MAGLYIKSKRRPKVVIYWLLTLIIVGLIGVGGWFLFAWYMTGTKPPIIPLPASALANPSVDETPITKKQIDEYTVPATNPRYITIPSLGIEKVRVQTVGLTKAKDIDTPKNIGDTAWYNESAHPGQGYGVVVINGHNGGISRDGVFVGLGKLAQGDEIIVERGDGKVIHYEVVENKTESLAQANKTGMKRLFTPYDKTKEGLGLITCAGNWVPRNQVFDERILIRAVVVD